MRYREAWSRRRLLEASSNVQNFCRVKLTKKATKKAIIDEKTYQRLKRCVSENSTARLTKVAAPPDMTNRRRRIRDGYRVLARAYAARMEGKGFAIENNRTRKV